MKNNYNLSFFQLDEMVAKEQTTYSENISFVIFFQEKIEIEILKKSILSLTVRQEILRSYITVNTNKKISQVIGPYEMIAVQMEEHFFSKINNKKVSFKKIYENEKNRITNIINSPLSFFKLVACGENDYRLIVVLHPLVCDRSSIILFYRELVYVYTNLCVKNKLLLNPLPLKYIEFSEWQRNNIVQKCNLLDKNINYWYRKLIASNIPITLALDRYVIKKINHAVKSYQLNCPTGIATKVKALATKTNGPLWMTLLSSFMLLLHKYSDENNILIGIQLCNRNYKNVEELIGNFTNIYPFLSTYNEKDTIEEYLLKTIHAANEILEHADVSFALLADSILKNNENNLRDHIKILFCPEQYDSYDIILDTDMQVSISIKEPSASKHDLMLRVIEKGDETLNFIIEYSTELYNESTIVQLLKNYINCLQNYCLRAQTTLSAYESLTKKCYQRLSQWNMSNKEYEGMRLSLSDYFEKQVEKTPNAIALIANGHQITYTELNERSNQIARYLKKNGVKEETLVGVSLEPSFDLVSCILGVWKAGGAYLPLDPTYPGERIKYMLDDSGTQIIISESNLFISYNYNVEKLIKIDVLLEEIKNEKKDNLFFTYNSSHLAYLMYTSGSTGKPKGVMGLHVGMINRMEWMWFEFPFTDDEICAQKTSINFIDSIWEIFGPLLKGIKTILFNMNTVKNIPVLIEQLSQNNVSRVTFVPSFLEAFISYVEVIGVQLNSLRYISVSGEALQDRVIKQYFKVMKDVPLINLYGSSEVSADATYICYRECAISNIGKPLANVQIFILDKSNKRVPIGAIGEIHVGGMGIARGYLNQPDLTKERFIDNPFTGLGYSRLYKTGDLGRFLPNGNIEYFGRVDRQIKLRGQRIEPGEVESILKISQYIKDAVVVANMKISKQSLIAYLVLENNNNSINEVECILDDLKSTLKKFLPAYMMPAQVIFIPFIPLNVNGKSDYNQLKLIPSNGCFSLFKS